MALKPITLRLDEEEYEKLREYLNAFGDPDINVAYVMRSYIRDLNRALPFFVKAGWDLKSYFGLLGSWLKQVGTMTDLDILSKMIPNLWAMWTTPGKSSEQDADAVGTAKTSGHNPQGKKETNSGNAEE